MDTIRYEVAERTATITLNRPEQLNALSPAMVQELREAYAEAEGDDAVWTIVVTGEGRAFCTGADVGEIPDDGRVIYPERSEPLWSSGHVQVHVLRLNLGLRRRHGCAIQHATELTHIARPVVRDEPRQRGAGELLFSDLVPNAPEQRPRKLRDVALALTQSRDVNDDGGQTMIEIRAKAAFLDALVQRGPARRDDPHVDL
jgi:hypothetical protein